MLGGRFPFPLAFGFHLDEHRLAVVMDLSLRLYKLRWFFRIALEAESREKNWVCLVDFGVSCFLRLLTAIIVKSDGLYFRNLANLEFNLNSIISVVI